MNKAGEEVASVDVPVDRYIFFATEDAEVDVPIVNKKRMCRNGCCTTCAVKVLEGKVRMRRQSAAKGCLAPGVSKCFVVHRYIHPKVVMFCVHVEARSRVSRTKLCTSLRMVRWVSVGVVSTRALSLGMGTDSWH